MGDFFLRIITNKKDSGNGKYLETIQSQTEAAKDPSRYETYEYHLYKNEKLFAARTIGQSHIKRGMPCQDYCLATSINGYFVLADADGVSSCEHSDVGSKFACEAVLQAVESAAKAGNGKEKLEETTFVNRILSVSFRERLIQFWVNKVMKEIADKHESPLTPEEQLKEFYKYASTVMFAVISENWIVVGNLGDGQILVFNDSYGIQLRLHTPKESGKVKCLVHARCAREDFQVAKYPRKFFNGVLLSTDGIYDNLNGKDFNNYAFQIKQRFLEKRSPYQPFCYEKENKLYEDFSITSDDCSIVLFVDNSHIDTGYEIILDSIRRHLPEVVLKRWKDECLLFHFKNNEEFGDVLVEKQHIDENGEIEDNTISLDGLRAAVADAGIEVDAPLETWTEQNYIFSSYVVDSASLTMEEMYCYGLLRIDGMSAEFSAEKILKVYCSVKKLQNRLKDLGYELSSTAQFNVFFDGSKLHVRREAIQKMDEARPAVRNDIEKYFDNIVGILKSEKGDSQPVFDVGYRKQGIINYISEDANEDDWKKIPFDDVSDEEVLLLPDGRRLFLLRDKKILSPFAQLFRDPESGDLYLKNVGSYSWKFDDGKILQPEDSIELQDEITFTLCGIQGEELDKYTYIPKEKGGFYD